MSDAVRLNSHSHWGRKGGMVMPDGSLGIKQGQWGAGSSRDGKNTSRRFYWPMRRKLMGSGNIRIPKAPVVKKS